MDCDSITPAARIFNKNKYYKYLSPITNKSQNYFALVCAPTTPPALLRSPSHSLSSIYTNCHKTNTFVHSPLYILFLFDTPLAHYCVPPYSVGPISAPSRLSIDEILKKKSPFLRRKARDSNQPKTVTN